MTATRYFTFTVGGLLLGIPVALVQEVVRDVQVVPVPLSHAYLAGMLNLRGRIVTVINARERLQLATSEADIAAGRVIVILAVDDDLVSLAVDREGEVLVIDDHQSEDVPETIGSAIREILDGAYQLADGLLLVVNPDRFLSLPVA